MRVACASALAVLLGCSPSPPPSALVRLIGEEPEAFLRPGDLAELEQAFRWKFSAPGDLDGWGSRNLEGPPRIESGALVIRSGSEDPQILRCLDPVDETPHVVRVTVEGLSPAGVPTLYFTEVGEPFAEEKKILAEKSEGELVFDLARHPQWGPGRMCLRFDLTDIPDSTIRILDVVGSLKRRLRPVPQSALKVELDGDVRNAFVRMSGEPLVREITVPASATLRFGMGLWREIRGREPIAGVVVFRASFTPREGNRVELFERTISFSSEEPETWREATIDLATLSGRRGRLLLETSSSGSTDPRYGIPLWANPEVRGREPEESARWNAILISIDTLRPDHLSLYGYRRPTSPEIDRFAKQYGVTFETAVAPSPWTLPSHVSLLSGLDATRHGVNYETQGAPAGLEWLSERLQQNGWATAAITGGGFLDPRYGFTRGFDRYRYWMGRDNWERELATGIELALDYVSDRTREPFFLFFHTYEVHTPYRAREPFFGRWSREAPQAGREVHFLERDGDAAAGYRTRKILGWAEPGGRPATALEPEDIPTAVAMYDSGIAYADQQLGRLFRRLEEIGLAERTLVVLTSDHGEAFGEHGHYGHYALHEEELRVPLVMAFAKRLEGGRRIDRQVRSVDVPVTILDLLGIRDALRNTDGVSLVPLLEGRSAKVPDEAWSYSAQPNYGVSLRLGETVRYTFNDTVWAPARGEEHLYRLQGDSKERSNTAGSAAEDELRELRRRTRDELANLPGIRLRFSNDESRPLRATLRGSSRPVGLKSPKLPCDCLTRSQEGDVTVDVPPRTAFTLVLAESPRGSLELEVGFAGEASFGASLVPGDIEPWTAEYLPTSESWRRGDEPTQSSTSLRIWSLGGTGGRPDPSVRGDEELRERLRALGYVQ